MSSKHNPDGRSATDAAPPLPKPVIMPFSIAEDADKLLARDEKGRPAVLSYWPEGTPPSERVLRINIPQTAEEMAVILADDHKRNFVNYMIKGANRISRNNQVAAAVASPALIAAYHVVAKELENTYGIRIDIRTSPDLHANPHMTAAGLKGFNIGGLGASTFPPGTDLSGALSAASSRGFTQEQLAQLSISGMVLMPIDGLVPNNPELFLDFLRHELGHFMGLYHPSESTVVLPGKGQTAAFAAMLTVMSSECPPESAAGPFVKQGALESIALRRVLGKPLMNTGDNTYSPDLAYVASIAPGVFQSRRITNVYGNAATPYALTIIDNGGHDRFILPSGDAVNALDTNPGMVSVVNQQDEKRMRLVALLEGHIEEIFIEGGRHNHIVASRAGAQEFIVKGGTSEIIVEASKAGETAGRKTIINQGGEVVVRLPLALAQDARIGQDKNGQPLLRLSNGLEIALETDARGKPASTRLEAIGADKAVAFACDLGGLRNAADWQARLALPLTAFAAAEKVKSGNAVSRGANCEDISAPYSLPVRAEIGVAAPPR